MNRKPGAAGDDKVLGNGDHRLHAAAEPLFLRSLENMEKTLEPDHPSVAAVLKNTADLYAKMEKTEQARALADHAAKIDAMKR